MSPLLAKNACSPDENTNDSPQSRQVSDRSWNTPRSSNVRRGELRCGDGIGTGVAGGVGARGRTWGAELLRGGYAAVKPPTRSNPLRDGVRPPLVGARHRGNRGRSMRVRAPMSDANKIPSPSSSPPSRSAPVPRGGSGGASSTTRSGRRDRCASCRRRDRPPDRRLGHRPPARRVRRLRPRRVPRGARRHSSRSMATGRSCS